VGMFSLVFLYFLNGSFGFYAVNIKRMFLLKTNSF